MLDASGVGCDTGVLEIGPGIGTLTRELSARAARVAAVEIDRALLPVLAETLADCENTRVYHADALKLDLPAFCREALPCRELAVCANLPYYITTPAVTMLLESKLFRISRCFCSAKLWSVSAPVPARPVTAPCLRSCGITPSRSFLFRVPADCFIPRPKVASAVLSLTPVAADVSPERERTFRAIVRAAFAQRRKTLQNALSAAALCSREEAVAAIRACGFREDVRGEMLDRRFLQAGRCSAGLIGEVRYGTTRIARYPNSRYRRSGF